VRPFDRLSDGRIVGSFTRLEAELIVDFASQVAELLESTQPLASDRLLASFGIGGGDGPSSDPALARLLPNAYQDDDEAALEFRHFTERSLVSRKVDSAQTVVTWLSTASGVEVELDPAAQQAWLRTLTNIRLVIAARLGIEKEGDEARTETEEEFILAEVYDWLGMVQETLVDAIDA
jgi:hypothetical protein